MSWITDRFPTKGDSYNGEVQVPHSPFYNMNQVGGESYLYTKHWLDIKRGEPWYPHPSSVPKILYTPK